MMAAPPLVLLLGGGFLLHCHFLRQTFHVQLPRELRVGVFSGCSGFARAWSSPTSARATRKICRSLQRPDGEAVSGDKPESPSEPVMCRLVFLLQKPVTARDRVKTQRFV